MFVFWKNKFLLYYTCFVNYLRKEQTHLSLLFIYHDGCYTLLLIFSLKIFQAAERAQQLLDYMRVGARSSHRPAEMSGGEQQRVAIARAVANSPYVLLADEPTGNLDPTTAGYVFDALTALVRQSGVAALIATHNHMLAGRMDRAITLEGGKIVPFVLDDAHRF